MLSAYTEVTERGWSKSKAMTPSGNSYHHDEANHHITSTAECGHYTFAGTALNAWHDRIAVLQSIMDTI